MSFTDQKPKVATEEDIHARWDGVENGVEFYCSLCGYVFQVGDVWRWVYGGHLSNLIVCRTCDGENHEVLEKWKLHGGSGWLRSQQRKE